MLADGDDRQDEAVFGKMTPVTNYNVLHYFVDGAGIDAHAAYRDLRAAPRAVRVHLQRLAGFEHERFFEASSAQMLRQRGMFGKLPVLAVNGEKVARAHQVQNQLQLFVAALSGDEYR